MIAKEKMEMYKAIIRLGYKIVYFKGVGSWLFTGFTPADGKMHFYHRVIGKNISYLEFPPGSTLDKNVLFLKIEQLEQEEIWLHANIKFQAIV